MAEGFARRYGADVIEAGSAGIAPASIVQPQTRWTMAEKNIAIDDQFPKAYQPGSWDLVVNMSGLPLPGPAPAGLRVWRIDDPIGASEETYRRVRDQIEVMVMALVLELRRGTPPALHAPRQRLKG